MRTKRIRRNLNRGSVRDGQLSSSKRSPSHKRFAIRHTTELFPIPEEDTFLVLLKEKIATERIFELRG